MSSRKIRASNITSGTLGGLLLGLTRLAIGYPSVFPTGTTRPAPVPYDFTPKLRGMEHPPELAVMPPNHFEPDALRNR